MILFKVPGGDIVTLRPGDIIEYGEDPDGDELVVNTRSSINRDDFTWYLAWDLRNEQHARKVMELIWNEIRRQAGSQYILIDVNDIVEEARSML